jgi:hypothetical protein
MPRGVESIMIIAIRSLIVFFLFLSMQAWSDMLTLVNDSSMQLSAEIQDATGATLEEVVIDAGDSTTWSLNYEYYGYESQPQAPTTPYTVNWYCMSGDLFGTCMDVDSDTTVRAQSCGGAQQCGQSSDEEE